MEWNQSSFERVQLTAGEEWNDFICLLSLYFSEFCSCIYYILLYYCIYWTDYIDDEYTSIIIDFCIDTNMNADIIVVDSCGTVMVMVIDRMIVIILFIFLSLFYARLISRWMGMRFFFLFYFYYYILTFIIFARILLFFIVFFFTTRASINFYFSYTYCYEMHNPLVLLLTIFLYNNDIHGFVLF